MVTSLIFVAISYYRHRRRDGWAGSADSALDIFGVEAEEDLAPYGRGENRYILQTGQLL
jgi:hypothetical protein